MRFLSFILVMLVGVSFSSARFHKDLVFIKDVKRGNGDVCVAKKSTYIPTTYNATGELCSYSNVEARLRVFNPQRDESEQLGLRLVRPFLIIDGIYLGTDENRTLSGMEEEVERFGILDPLVELGYMPILVQFSETVKKSLQENAQTFAAILKFMNSNVLFGFDNKQTDGFVVLGVSQGGILGRYGSYLYDKDRNKSKDAPIRLYASLDSPHQGAVMPLSLYYTINFWAKEGGSADAEAFRDLIDGPGASGLLLHQKKCSNEKCSDYTYEVDASTERFLFGEYRKAAEYKGFPSVLVAQGQLKGKIPAHSDTYFVLNRHANKYGSTYGRAESKLYAYTDGKKQIAKNRIYRFPGDVEEHMPVASATYDFVQGSTYPFAETMYQGLRSGMLNAMPKGMKQNIAFVPIELATNWDEDSLMQKNGTFIPTVSAMDLNCGGKFAVTDDCAFTQSQSGFPFTNPGTKSSANAVYAVDATHPRYNEAISGRHIELPENETIKTDSAVLGGLQVDMWRVLCELANYDYDAANKEFRNEHLAWYFAPATNCMDQTKMPSFLKKGGYVQKKYFAYSRYDYNADATEIDESVTFDVPAGWHKVASYNNNGDLPEGASFEIDVTVNSSKGSWMKAEVLLLKSLTSNTQLQLQEKTVPVDGKTHHLYWKFPAGEGNLKNYRWIRLVLNSDGGNVTVANPVLTRTMENSDKKYEVLDENMYPNESYRFVPWTSETTVTPRTDALGLGSMLQYHNYHGGAYLDLKGEKNADSYSKLYVYYSAGTCQGTGVYFDSYASGMQLLSKDAYADGNFLVKEIALSDIIDTKISQNHRKIVSRLVFANTKMDEKCFVYGIFAK